MPFHRRTEIDEAKKAIARERARDRRQQARYRKLVWNPQSAGRKLAASIKNDVALISSLGPVDKHGRAITSGTDPIQAVHLRKQLLLSWLDAMATIYDRIVCPQRFKVRGDNKRRFLEFVGNECGWRDCHRVSIPTLLRTFQLRRRAKQPTASLSMMRYLGRAVRSHLDSGQDVRSAEIDPYISNLLRDRAVRKGSLEDDVIKEHELVILLYGLRNSRLHDMRDPTNADDAFMSNPNAAEPVYQDFANEKALHLLFPETFIRNLVLTGADSLERLCTWNDVDPYRTLPENVFRLEKWTPKKVWKRPKRK